MAAHSNILENEVVKRVIATHFRDKGDLAAVHATVDLAATCFETTAASDKLLREATEREEAIRRSAFKIVSSIGAASPLATFGPSGLVWPALDLGQAGEPANLNAEMTFNRDVFMRAANPRMKDVLKKLAAIEHDDAQVLTELAQATLEKLDSPDPQPLGSEPSVTTSMIVPTAISLGIAVVKLIGNHGPAVIEHTERAHSMLTKFRKFLQGRKKTEATRLAAMAPSRPLVNTNVVLPELAAGERNALIFAATQLCGQLKNGDEAANYQALTTRLDEFIVSIQPHDLTPPGVEKGLVDGEMLALVGLGLHHGFRELMDVISPTAVGGEEGLLEDPPALVGPAHAPADEQNFESGDVYFVMRLSQEILNPLLADPGNHSTEADRMSFAKKPVSGLTAASREIRHRYAPTNTSKPETKGPGNIQATAP